MEGIVLRVVSALCEEPEPLVRGQMAHKRIEAERQNTAEEIAGIAEPSEQTSQQIKTILPSGPSHKNLDRKTAASPVFSSWQDETIIRMALLGLYSFGLIDSPGRRSVVLSSLVAAFDFDKLSPLPEGGELMLPNRFHQ